MNLALCGCVCPKDDALGVISNVQITKAILCCRCCWFYLALPASLLITGITEIKGEREIKKKRNWLGTAEVTQCCW